MFRYIPFRETLYSDEIGSYISFGILAVDETQRPITSVSDVSVCEAFVKDLCERCTRYQLYPIHLSDVIEDSI